MKLTYCTGCTSDTLNIDGKESIDMTKEEIIGHINMMLTKVEDISTLQEVLKAIAQGSGEYEDLGQCETCGDWAEEYTFEY